MPWPNPTLAQRNRARIGIWDGAGTLSREVDSASCTKAERCEKLVELAPRHLISQDGEDRIARILHRFDKRLASMAAHTPTTHTPTADLQGDRVDIHTIYCRDPTLECSGARHHLKGRTGLEIVGDRFVPPRLCRVGRIFIGIERRILGDRVNLPRLGIDPDEDAPIGVGLQDTPLELTLGDVLDHFIDGEHQIEAVGRLDPPFNAGRNRPSRRVPFLDDHAVLPLEILVKLALEPFETLIVDTGEA